MAIHIDDDMAFMGLSMHVARRLLRDMAELSGSPFSWGHWGNGSQQRFDARIAMAFAAEATRRGWIRIAGEDVELTDLGNAIALSRTTPRVPRKRAQKALDELLARCAALNADPAEPTHVDEVWLFGSMLGDAPTVGNVDLVVLPRWSAKYAAMDEIEAERAALRHADRHLPQHAKRLIVNSEYRLAWFNRQVYGERKQVLADRRSLPDLIEFGSPCRLVFSAAEGRTEGPLMARHPASPGRDPKVPGQAALPDLHAPLDAPVQPAGLSMVGEFRGSLGVPGAERLIEMYRPSSHLPGREERFRLIRDLENVLGLIRPDTLRQVEALMPAGDRFVILDADERASGPPVKVLAAVGPVRSIAVEGDAAEVSVMIDARHPAGTRPILEYENLVADFAVFLAGSDLQTVVRSRANEGRPLASVRVAVRAAAEGAFSDAVMALVRAATKAPGWHGRLPDDAPAVSVTVGGP